MRADPRDQEIAHQQAALAKALAELAELRAKFDALVAQGAKTNEQLGELVAAARRKGRREPPPPAPAAPLEVDDDAREAYENRPAAPKLPDREKPPKQPHKPTGRKPLPDHLPADEHVLRPDACAQCGGVKLDAVDEVVEEKLDLIREHYRRRRVRRKTCRCRECGARTTARSLPAPYDRSKVTSSWLAWLVHVKFAMLVPLDRVRRELAAQGIPLATSTLVGFIERAADLLESVAGLHWKQLLAGRWMATDATGLKVLVPNLKSAHNGYLEVYRRDDVVVLQYEASKDGATAVSKLAPFTGTLVADAEHRYNGVYADGRVLEAGCNAHGRRKLRDAEAVQPTLAAEGGAFISAMYAAEHEAKQLGLVGDALRDWR